MTRQVRDRIITLRQGEAVLKHASQMGFTARSERTGLTIAVRRGGGGGGGGVRDEETAGQRTVHKVADKTQLHEATQRSLKKKNILEISGRTEPLL